jgi:thioredoxin 1
VTPTGPEPTGELPGRRHEAVVLTFVAPWCGPCRRLEPLLDEVAASHRSVVRFETIRVDQQPDMVERYAVRATPTIVVMRGGHEMTRSVGAVSRTELERLFAVAGSSVSKPIGSRAGGRPDALLRFSAGASLVVAGAVSGPQLVLVVIGMLVLAWAGFGRRKAKPREPLAPVVSGSGQ